jgi:ectoine hydroxylase-related dioxygenase (phytanoyl-CoA dioxygenase family)
MKQPGGIVKPYHQDSYYFTIEPMELVTCWTALDDVTLENGCMWVIPGSHRKGIIDHEDWFIGDRPDKQIPEEAIERERETAIVMSAGSASFHHSVLLHRSAANRSDRPRRGLAVHYMSARSKWTHPELPKPDYMLLRGREFPECV